MDRWIKTAEGLAGGMSSTGTGQGPFLSSSRSAARPARVDAMNNRNLETVLRANPVCAAILDGAATLGLPDWYLGAGAVAQTVWNCAHGRSPGADIADFDLVYFDADDLGEEAEKAAEAAAVSLFGRFGVQIDVTNEARVHLWYEHKFGVKLEPYASVEAAIATWPTTASSIGVASRGGRFSVHAPFGTDDLWALIVRPNKTLVTRSVYEAKAARWSAIWPRLTIVPW